MIKKMLEDQSKETLFLNFNKTHSYEFSLTEKPDKEFTYSNVVNHYSVVDYSRRLFRVNDFYIAYSESDLPLFICKDLETMLNKLEDYSKHL